jgi:hypothetical protein
MRIAKPMELDRISQVLAKGACPICAFLKNDQAALLRGDLPPEQVSDLCNFHGWALAAAADSANAAQVFLNVLHKGDLLPRDTPNQCSFCSQLLQLEVAHIRELIGEMDRGFVREWMERQGTFCRVHAAHVRQLSPLKLHTLIDEIVERSTKSLETELQNLLKRTEVGKGTGGGILGRAAEFLISQRGINR